MIFDIYHRTGAIFYYRIYFIHLMVSSISFTHFILSTTLTFLIFSTPLILLILCFPILEIKSSNIIALMYLGVSNLWHQLKWHDQDILILAILFQKRWWTAFRPGHIASPLINWSRPNLGLWSIQKFYIWVINKVIQNVFIFIRNYCNLRFLVRPPNQLLEYSFLKDCDNLILTR